MTNSWNPATTDPRSPGSRRNRRRIWQGGLTALVVATVYATTMSALGTPDARAVSTDDGWTTVWRDDFTGAAGSGLDTAEWLYDTGTSYPGGAPSWGTGEVETMTSSTANVALDGAGHLAITPLRNAEGNWTSGRVETQRTDFAAPEGGIMRVEGSLQQPNVTAANGAGYWPAFWMLGEAARPVSATNWPSIGEIDVMENVNGRSSVWGTLHCGTVSGGPCNETTGLSTGEHPCPGCQTSFHTYAVEYDRSTSPEQLRWYLDGVVYHTLTADSVDATTWSNALHHGFFIIFNVAMGGGFPAAFGAPVPTDATVSGRPMLIDYVAVYTKAASSPTPTTPSPTPTTPSPTTTSPSPTTTSPSPTTTSPAPTPTTPTTGSGDRNAYSTIEAESYDGQSGTLTEVTTDTGGGKNVGWIADGDWLLYRNVDFGSTPARQFLARVASGAAGGISGLVEVRLDDRDAAPVGTFSIANTGGWQSWRTVPANMSAVTGVHDVYLTFTSAQPNDYVNVNWITFTA